jgi:hypothetical protein
LNFNDGHVHENYQNITGHQNLKHVMKFKKYKLKKVQNTIRIGIEFINNGKPFKVSSKRSKMLMEIKSNTTNLDSNNKGGYSPSYSPKTKPFLRISGPQEQVIPNLKETMQSKSLEHTNEIQVDFSGSKMKPKEAKLKEKIVMLKATNKAITYRREIDMHTVINKKTR